MMPPNASLLAAALKGYEIQRELIETKIAEIRRHLADTHGTRETGKRNLSPEARARISRAQRKRWAKFRKGATT